MGQGDRGTEGDRRRRVLPPPQRVNQVSISNDFAAVPAGFGEKPSLTRQPRRGERVAEFVLRLVALTSIASILLILFFVAREAVPILYDTVVRQEVTPSAMVVPR